MLFWKERRRCFIRDIYSTDKLKLFEKKEGKKGKKSPDEEKK